MKVMGWRRDGRGAAMAGTMPPSGEVRGVVRNGQRMKLMVIYGVSVIKASSRRWRRRTVGANFRQLPKRKEIERERERAAQN